jgi:plastocyanin
MATGRRWLVLTMGIAVSLPAVLIGTAGAESMTVTLAGRQFVPPTVQIFTGDTVTWKYQSGGQHTVTFDDGTDLNPACPGVSPLVNDCLNSPGETVSRKFTQLGTYGYHCKIHESQGMVGEVKVSAPPTTVPPASTSTTAAPSSTTTTKPTTTTTTTTRPLATSSTVVRSTTTTFVDTTTTLTPGAAPSFDPGSSGSQAAGESKGTSKDSTTVAVIVALLLAVAAGGGVLLWRLRPGRSG